VIVYRPTASVCPSCLAQHIHNSLLCTLQTTKNISLIAAIILGACNHVRSVSQFRTCSCQSCQLGETCTLPNFLCRSLSFALLASPCHRVYCCSCSCLLLLLQLSTVAAAAAVYYCCCSCLLLPLQLSTIAAAAVYYCCCSCLLLLLQLSTIAAAAVYYCCCSCLLLLLQLSATVAWWAADIFGRNTLFLQAAIKSTIVAAAVHLCGMVDS
jgi:hypothetical protein